jgi:hypothetical protein
MYAGRSQKVLVIEQLEKLLEPDSAEEFMASIWGQTYRHIRGWKGKFAHLLPWDQLNLILRQHRLDFPRLRLVLDGQRLSISSYLRHITGGRGRPSLPRLQTTQLTEQLRRGATLVLDAVDELYEPLEDLAAALELFFREHVQINTYAGWHTSHGFDLHWDDHDVFILQVVGRKRWSIYGMTRRFPFVGMREPSPKPDASNPLWEATLEDGDLLYIPRGWWHVAQPLDEPTLHLTIGIHNRSGVDLLRWLTERMSDAEIFRQDLPRFGSTQERAAHLNRLREELLSAWSDDLLERYFADLDQKAEARARPSLPWAAMTDALPSSKDALVRLAAPRPLDFKIEDGVVEFSTLKQRWRFAADALPILRLLDEQRLCTIEELCTASAGKLDKQTVRMFLRELLLHGLIALVKD